MVKRIRGKRAGTADLGGGNKIDLKKVKNITKW